MVPLARRSLVISDEHAAGEQLQNTTTRLITHRCRTCGHLLCVDQGA